MLSVETCRGYLGSKELTDEQITTLRDAVYELVAGVLGSTEDEYTDASC